MQTDLIIEDLASRF